MKETTFQSCPTCSVNDVKVQINNALNGKL